VNWYLRRNVGCFRTRDRGKNWAFSSDAKPGIVFIPPTAHKKVAPTKSTAVPWEPLPLDAKDRFNKALDALEQKVNGVQDPQNWRYKCWIKKLRAGADDRVIQWSRIYPLTSGPIGGAFVIGRHNMGDGTPVDQRQLEALIQSVGVLRANELLEFITYTRSAILSNYELSGDTLQMEDFRRFYNGVIEAIDNLNRWANSQSGGSIAMPRAYLSLKDWITQQQRNPSSIYSCESK